MKLTQSYEIAEFAFTKLEKPGEKICAWTHDTCRNPVEWRMKGTERKRFVLGKIIQRPMVRFFCSTHIGYVRRAFRTYK